MKTGEQAKFLGQRVFTTDSGDRVPVGGSFEHYFHYLLGFLLPAVWEANRKGYSELFLDDYGPTMNPITEGVFEELGVRIHLGGDSPYGCAEVSLDPWDHHVSDVDALHTAATILRDRAFTKEDCCRSAGPGAARLILQRSPSPEFYRENGGARIPGYGTSRREITNVSGISRFLEIMRVPHCVYEPGAHSLWCQIRHFSMAEKFLGVRGAEWANALWCKPSAELRILYPLIEKNQALENYLDSLGLRYKLAFTNTWYPRESLIAAYRHMR